MPWSGLCQRALQPEIMDQPDLDPQLHAKALRALALVNRLSASAAMFERPIRELARRVGTPLTILDLACGGGDVTIALGRRLKRHGVLVRIVGIDKSATAIEMARRRAARAGSDAEFAVASALERQDEETFDVVITSLFMHHLNHADALRLLERMQATARHLVLVNDLARSRFGWLLAVVVSHLITRSPVVHVDGPRSVEGAFSVGEARQLAAEAGLRGAAVGRRWPCRFLLSWTRTSDVPEAEMSRCAARAT